MKQLLKYAKNLEQDFTNSNATYQSKIDLAVTSLVMGDYDKSKQMFDAAIELDSMYPSAWLGKAFVEIARVDDEHFNSLEIDEYLNRALRSNAEITAYKVALAGCLAYRHAVLIKKYVQAVETAMEEQRKAKQKAMTGLVVAAAGTMFTGGNKSITSNIVGGALIGGGVTTAISSGLKSMELEKLGNSIYSAALGQTYLSIPIIRLCESLTGSNIDNDLKHNFNTVVDSWKDSVLYLAEKQKKNLEDNLKDIKELKISKFLKEYKTIKSPLHEINALMSFITMLGLKNSKLYNSLNNLVDKLNVNDSFSSPEKYKALFIKIVVLNNLKALAISFPVYIALMFGSSKSQESAPGAFIIIQALVVVALSKFYAPKEFKQIGESYTEIKNTQLTRADFNLTIMQ